MTLMLSKTYANIISALQVYMGGNQNAQNNGLK